MTMAITNDREYRTYSFEKVVSDKPNDMRVQGLAITYDNPTVLFVADGVEYHETIDRGALEGATMSDVVLNVNHVGRPVAKTKNGTLILKNTQQGLEFEADLSKIERAREVFREVEENYLDEMSFAFTVKEEAYDKETRTRTIKKIDRLFDISCVDIPAYSGTSLKIAERQKAFFEVEAEKELVEARATKFEAMKLKLKMKLREKEEK